MPVFFGEMQMTDTPTTMPAVVHVEKGSIRIQSGKTVLGEWKLSQVRLRERDASTVSLETDGEELLLRLREHASFLAETQAFRPDEKRLQRMRTHEAFRQEEEQRPTLAEEVREDVSREVSSVAEEVRDLANLFPTGPALWIGLVVLVLLVIFLPTLVLGVLLGGGILALLVGALAYADTKIATKLPGEVTPLRLVAIGFVAVVAGVVIAIIL